MDRRTFVHRSLLAGLGASLPFSTRAVILPAGVEANPITTGPRQHWFGYYDKWQVSADGRYALGGEVDLFFRSPRLEDRLQVGLIDLQNGNAWQTIGESTAWGWQQGCMMQWIPGSSEEVIWNDREGEGFVSRIYNLHDQSLRTLPRPIYTLSPDGRYGLGIDFDRLQFFRPGYGYTVESWPASWERAPQDKGIYRIDLHTGRHELILSYAEVARLKRPLGSVRGNYHWINHLLISPGGSRFIFLNRSRPVPSEEQMRAYRKNNPNPLGGQFSSMYITRAITANVDGSDLYCLNDSGNFSHFIWKGEEAICAWATPEGSDRDAFYVFRDRSKQYELLDPEAMPFNGHNTYVPGTDYEWILNDTYPKGEARLQELYLYHVPTRRKVVLGRFHEPVKFAGEWRCDLHPRCDPAGKQVFFDSTHEGGRRQMYRVDIAGIIG